MIATSAPAFANARAVQRPDLRAAPVTSAVLPVKGFAKPSCMQRFYRLTVQNGAIFSDRLRDFGVQASGTSFFEQRNRRSFSRAFAITAAA